MGTAILRKIEQYLRQHDMPRTKFGRLAVKDPRLVDDLRNGRTPGPNTCARIEAMLAQPPATSTPSPTNTSVPQ